MEINPKIVEKYLKELECREFYTLSKKVPFYVTYEKNHIVVINKNSNVIRIGMRVFNNLIIEVLISRSFKNNHFKNYYHSHYLLPIILEIFLFYKENLNGYDLPFNSMNDVKLSSKKDKLELDSVTSTKRIERESMTEFIQSSCSYDSGVIEEIIDIHYATNRVRVGGKKIFGSEVDNKTNYGIAKVSIPKEHRFGKIEKPIGIFNFRLSEKRGKHFTIDDSTELTFSEFKKSLTIESSSDSIILFIHGYNVDFKNALYKTAQIKKDFQYTLPFLLYSWPSHADILAYSGDKERVDQSVDCLAKLLSDLSQFGIRNISVIAHSMGTYCLVKALKKLNSKDEILDSLALASPDIPKAAFISDYLSYVKSTFSRIALYASSKDKALKVSKRINRDVRLGQSGKHISVIDGVETIDVSRADFGLFKMNHSSATENTSSMKDLRDFMVLKQPAKERLLKEAFTWENKLYWFVHK